ncbi:MAG: ECF transporter S component [Bacillota bacterium]
MTKTTPTLTLILTGALIALGVLLPMAFHTVGLGRVFLPMHIPVLLAGFLVGPLPGMVTGMVTPALSALLTGMPPLAPMPVAQTMVFELGTYGLLAGLAYRKLRLGTLPALILAMAGGRLVYGLIGFTLLPLIGLRQVPLLLPLTTGLVTGLPGLILQLVFVPTVVTLVTGNVKGLWRRS